jgi:hypothetical protein
MEDMKEELMTFMINMATEVPEELIEFTEATTNLKPRENPEHMKALKMQVLISFLKKMGVLDEKNYLFAMQCVHRIFDMEIEADKEKMQKTHDDIVALREEPPTKTAH